MKFMSWMVVFAVFELCSIKPDKIAVLSKYFICNIMINAIKNHKQVKTHAPHN